MVSRIIIDLASDDDKAIVRLLKALLKRPGRDHGVKCKGITATAGDGCSTPVAVSLAPSGGAIGSVE